MMEKLKNKKIQYTLAFGVVAGALLLFQGIMPSKPPKIISISPDRGYPGIMVTITGSGFTKQSNNVSETRIGGQKLDPGNYIKILGEVQNSHAFSLDGTTLQIKLELNTNHVVQECIKRVNQNKPCEVGIKVINAYGIESNEFHYLVINRPPPLRASYEVIPLDHANPTGGIALHISDPYRKLTEVFRYKITADQTNDAPIYVDAGRTVYALTVDAVPVNCSKLLYQYGFGLIDITTNGTLDVSNLAGNVPGGPLNNGMDILSLNGWCTQWPIDLFYTLAPGEQKIISVVTRANANAVVGTRFKSIIGNSITSDPGGIDVSTRDVLISNHSGSDWLDGGGEWSNIITVAP